MGWVSARRGWAIASFGAIFSKISDTGETFFFLDWFGKVVFIVVLSVVGENGAVQTGMSSALGLVSFGQFYSRCHTRILALT